MGQTGSRKQCPKISEAHNRTCNHYDFFAGLMTTSFPCAVPRYQGWVVQFMKAGECFYLQYMLHAWTLLKINKAIILIIVDLIQ